MEVDSPVQLWSVKVQKDKGNTVPLFFYYRKQPFFFFFNTFQSCNFKMTFTTLVGWQPIHVFHRLVVQCKRGTKEEQRDSFMVLWPQRWERGAAGKREQRQVRGTAKGAFSPGVKIIEAGNRQGFIPSTEYRDTVMVLWRDGESQWGDHIPESFVRPVSCLWLLFHEHCDSKCTLFDKLLFWI